MAHNTLEEKRNEAITVVFRLNLAIYELENACDGEGIRKAITLIPNRVLIKVYREIRNFCLHDITRTELVSVLQKQLKLRKRSMYRYLNMEKKEA